MNKLTGWHLPQHRYFCVYWLSIWILNIGPGLYLDTHQLRYNGTGFDIWLILLVLSEIIGLLLKVSHQNPRHDFSPESFGIPNIFWPLFPGKNPGHNAGTLKMKSAHFWLPRWWL